MESAEGRIVEDRRGSTLYLTIDHQPAMNAMTLAMWEALAESCARVADSPGIRAVVIAAAGERAFVAGTDIAEFRTFDGSRGLRYERRMDEVFAAIEAIHVPTIAAINGTCAGGGFLIAASCDLRFARKGVVFGIPVARTLGNTLSISSLRRAERAIGAGFARQMALLAKMIEAERLLAQGFLAGIADDRQALEAMVDATAASIAAMSPGSLRAIKAALQRAGASRDDDADLIESVYGSRDFREGVEAFLARRAAVWSDR
jgi:enoyl-CoA hydratase/carnithine racemase